jgi:preprotein translocase subunit SecG
LNSSINHAAVFNFKQTICILYNLEGYRDKVLKITICKLVFILLSFLKHYDKITFVKLDRGVASVEVFLTVVYVVICLGLIATVLLQSGKSAGLSGSIAGGAESLFGKKRGIDEKLSRFTAILAVSFLAMSVLMIIFIR